MIIAKLKWNTRLSEVDDFVQKFISKEKNQNFNIDIKLTDTACLVIFFQKFH